MKKETFTAQSILSEQENFGIIQKCPHGMIFLHFENLSLRFDKNHFDILASMVQEAFLKIGYEEPIKLVNHSVNETQKEKKKFLLMH